MNCWANTIAELQFLFVTIEKDLIVEIMQHHCIVARRNENLIPVGYEFIRIDYAHFIVAKNNLNRPFHEETVRKPALRLRMIRDFEPLNVFNGIFVKAVALRMGVGKRELIRIFRTLGSKPTSAKAK